MALATHWMLRELGVEHDQVIIDFPNGEIDSPACRAINPMGKVPTLQDGDVVVTETAAICAYLADKFLHKSYAPAIDSADRGLYYRYLLPLSFFLVPPLSRCLPSGSLIYPTMQCDQLAGAISKLA